jgi:hypothetical protein
VAWSALQALGRIGPASAAAAAQLPAAVAAPVADD